MNKLALFSLSMICATASLNYGMEQKKQKVLEFLQKENFDQVVELLNKQPGLKNDTNLVNRILFSAVGRGKVEPLRTLLNDVKDINTVRHTFREDPNANNGMTLFHLAVLMAGKREDYIGHNEIVRLLMEQKPVPNPDIVANDGTSAASVKNNPDYKNPLFKQQLNHAQTIMRKAND